MNWDDAKDLIVKFLAGGGVFLITYELHSLRKSVESLNTTVVEMFGETSSNTAQIASHEKRIDRLENHRH